MATSFAVSSGGVAIAAAPATTSDTGGPQFKILSSDGKQTIGTTRFTVLRDGSVEKIKGESKYLDGEHDSEDIRLTVVDAHSRPKLDTYAHSFFNADGSPHMVDTLDAKSGGGSCTIYAAGEPTLRKSQLQLPADLFAGSSGLMMVIDSLRQGNREMRFHAFACAPGPGIFSVVASRSSGSEHWPLYPGDLIRLDMKPDLGALNLVIAPFLPTTDAWFNPKDNWNYVGGEFDRYFRGPHVMSVRIAPTN